MTLDYTNSSSIAIFDLARDLGSSVSTLGMKKIPISTLSVNYFLLSSLYFFLFISFSFIFILQIRLSTKKIELNKCMVRFWFILARSVETQIHLYSRISYGDDDDDVCMLVINWGKWYVYLIIFYKFYCYQIELLLLIMPLVGYLLYREWR